MHAQIDAISKSEQELLVLSKAIEELKTSLQSSSAKQPRQQFVHANLSCITDAATASGMNIASCKVCSEKDKSWCSMN